LKNNVAINGLSNVECVASAVGERDGAAEFYYVGTTLPTSSSLSFNFMRSAENLESDTIPVTTLDSFVRDKMIDRLDLVKIDTETTEPEVLRGMQRTLSRDCPTIVCEVLKGRGTEQALEAVLGPLGYSYYLLTPEGPRPQARIEGHPEWLNYLFTLLSPEEITHLEAPSISSRARRF
jgi:FkbM family methyltransferase